MTFGLELVASAFGRKIAEADPANEAAIGAMVQAGFSPDDLGFIVVGNYFTEGSGLAVG